MCSSLSLSRGDQVNNRSLPQGPLTRVMSVRCVCDSILQPRAENSLSCQVLTTSKLLPPSLYPTVAKEVMLRLHLICCKVLLIVRRV